MSRVNEIDDEDRSLALFQAKRIIRELEEEKRLLNATIASMADDGIAKAHRIGELKDELEALTAYYEPDDEDG